MILGLNTCAETINVWQKVGMFLYVIKVIIPLILIIYNTIDIGKSITKNTEKEVPNLIKKTASRLAAALIIFYAPIIVNSFISLTNYKENKEFEHCSYCFTKPTSQECKDYITEAEEIIKEDEVDLTDKTLLEGSVDTSSYHTSSSGVTGNLDFSYEGNGTVKSRFSSETLRIVENHLYDLTYDNFYQVISSYGGFDNYAKSLGGVFGEYYGKTMEKDKYSVRDFQDAAEYVLGWMYMYGWDYQSGPLGQNNGVHMPWGGSSYAPDAFYVNGGWKTKYIGPFDDLISGKNGISMMASECGDLEIFIYEKLGISRKQQLPKVTRLRDLKVGDGIYFGREKKWNKLDENTWKSTTGGHNAIVGEVYDDHIVIYDTGRYFQMTRNFKRTVAIPQEDSEAADDAALQKEFGDLATGWGIRRWYDFE